MFLRKPWFSVGLLTVGSMIGCRSAANLPVFDATVKCPTPAFQGPSLLIEEPTEIVRVSSISYEPAPLDDFNFNSLESYRLMSLEECIFNALQSSPVIRELGGTTLQSPEQLSTTQDPALAYSNPLSGEEAALSAFDAVYSTQLLFQNNDRAFNNTFVGDSGFFQQNLATYRSGISKQSATGAQFEVNHGIDYDRNNTPANRFNDGASSSASYDNFLEAGFRQPLLQGAGVDFNRIAGPNNAAGVNNGVLIARTNTDISLAEFETQLRNLVSDVENAYWDLYYSYRDLEARIEVRDGAHKLWKIVDANEADAAVRSQAEEQYYRFTSDVENAIHGRLNEGTRTNNGSSGGTFRNTVGVRTSERRLRLITGMPLNGPQLIVPKDQPTDAELVFDWEQAKVDAVAYRPELRRQRWQIKKRELELVASRNQLLPQLDLLGRYRFRGFGEDLFGGQGFDNAGETTDVLSGSSATASLLDGDLQEWELGLDVNVPIGFRRAHAAKRFAEFSLARERAVLTEQERHVIYGLSNAMGELRRSTRVRNANRKRLEAAQAQFIAVNEKRESDSVDFDQVLDAQRRIIEAKTQFYQSQVEHMLALRSVHFEKGTLFQYHNVRMSESAWDGEAYEQAHERASWNTRQLSSYNSGIAVGKNNSSVARSELGSLSEVVQDFVSKKEIEKDDSASFSPEEAIAVLTKDHKSPLLEVAKAAQEKSADKEVTNVLESLKGIARKPSEKLSPKIAKVSKAAQEETAEKQVSNVLESLKGIARKSSEKLSTKTAEVSKASEPADAALRLSSRRSTVGSKVR